ncbi:MAG: hypothetical protein AAF978_00025 [Cyanobacteria bacterium P01_E01_bin.48]
MLVHPQTERQHSSLVEQAIADLRYGTVAVNLWAAAVGYLMMSATWRAFPGRALDDIQSGRRGEASYTMLICSIVRKNPSSARRSRFSLCRYGLPAIAPCDRWHGG